MGFLAVICTLFVGSFAFIDECSQYQNCKDCLNITSGENVRQNCGWCHVGIIYSDGTQGARCADIRDKPWQVIICLLSNPPLPPHSGFYVCIGMEKNYFWSSFLLFFRLDLISRSVTTCTRHSTAQVFPNEFRKHFACILTTIFTAGFACDFGNGTCQQVCLTSKNCNLTTCFCRALLLVRASEI